MTVMRRDLRIAAILALILILLSLAACGTQPETTPASDFAVPLGTPLGTNDQVILAATLTQEKNNVDEQAIATAEIVRANAEATLNSANATLGAVQTQDQNNADIIAAQVAATAEIVRADAQATLNSAVSTQNAALTQDVIRQTQALEQQKKDEIAAGTQTAVANIIATQTQSAAATLQLFADQARQRDEQRQAPITFLWMLCLPIFVVLLAGLVLWSFWRWVKIQQGQRILEKPVDRLQAPAGEVIDHQPDDSLPYLENGVADNRYQLTKPDDQAHRWVDEVKHKLLSDEKKDEDDGTNN